MAAYSIAIIHPCLSQIHTVKSALTVSVNTLPKAVLPIHTLSIAHVLCRVLASKGGLPMLNSYGGWHLMYMESERVICLIKLILLGSHVIGKSNNMVILYHFKKIVI